MKVRRIQPARLGLFVFAAIWMLVIVPLSAFAAPYAAYVMDARSGEVLHAKNADTRLHPASLTKMMTLYIAFEAVERGEISLDTMVKISSHAASEPPSKLGLKAGQKIALRYLIRAAAVKSANDAATAIGEALEGSEAAFARRMNRTAKSLGMTRSTFKNANGLTEQGHLSTAHDMSILGRHLIYDFPQYYNIFSRTSTDVGGRKVNSTNRRLLAAYKGADGIKTGYTSAAGFNLVASAERGNERIIATVFGGTSTAARNAKVAELLDLGFRAAPSNVKFKKPSAPAYSPLDDVPVASETAPKGAAGKTIRLAGTVQTSKRPQLRPGSEVSLASAAQPAAATASTAVAAVAEADAAKPVLVANAAPPAATASAEKATPTPSAPPANPALAAGIKSALVEAQIATATEAVTSQTLAFASPRPELRPTDLVQVSQAVVEEQPEVVTRLSTSGGRQWGVNIGRFPSRYKAEKVLLTTALAEMSTLDGSLRKVVKRPTGYDANFLGMTRESADLACRRLSARNISCFMVGPAS